MNEEIIVKKVETELGTRYDATWDSVHGTGKTHMEALKGLHYMLNFFDGTIENPKPLPVTIFKFEDKCEDTACPCSKKFNLCYCPDGTTHSPNPDGSPSKCPNTPPENEADEKCEYCGGKNGEHEDIPVVESVYPGEGHMADVGSRACPNLEANDEE